MFGLKVPIVKYEKTTDFDSVSTILSHSCIAKSSYTKTDPPWANSFGDDGGIFHLELPPGLEAKFVQLNNGDGGSVNSLVVSNGCSSEDTGYSSDQDAYFVDRYFSSDCIESNSRISAVNIRDSAKYKSYNGRNIVKIAPKKSFSSTQTKRHGKRSDISHAVEQESFGQHWGEHTKETENACSYPETEVDWGVCLGPAEFRSSKGSTNSSSSSTSNAKCSNTSNDRIKFTGSVRRDRPIKQKLEYKTINVHIQLNSARRGSRKNGSMKQSEQTLCELLLGIVPKCGDEGEPVKGGQGAEVIIERIVPGSPAHLKPEITVGSVLHKVNGKEITWANMNALLHSLSKLKKIKLSLKSIRQEKSTVDLDTLVNILTSDTEEHHALDKMAAMYISLEGVDPNDPDSTSDGMLYSFPNEQNSLHQLLGLFYTLAHLVKDIHKPNTIRNTTLSLDGQIVHIAYMQEENDVLVFAMPASCVTVFQLNTILLDFLRVLRVLFGSIESVFTKGLHFNFIDNLLTYLFRKAMSLPVASSSSSSSHLPASHAEEKRNLQSEFTPFIRHSQHVQAISLPNEITTTIGKIMNDFESSNFLDMSESFYGCRRQYTILGSAFMYCGQLVCSHLATEDLHDLWTYLQHLGIVDLMTQSSIAQFVVWREIFPSRFCHDIEEINNSFGYSEPNARWCWLIVGLKHGLFCCLLESASPTLLHQDQLLPDIFYIDQAKAFLLQMQTPHLVNVLNIKVNKDNHSTFAKSDFCATYVNTNCETMTHSFNDEHKGRSKISSSLVQHLDSSWNRHSLGSDFSMNSVRTGTLYTSHQSGRIDPTGKSHPALMTSSTFTAVPNIHRLSRTRYPSVYQYCCLDGLEGTLILGSDMISSGIFHSEIVHCFYQCCLQIRDVFITKANKRLLRTEPDEENAQLEPIIADPHLEGMKEHGILMNFKPNQSEGGHKNKEEAFTYWVVGRQLKRPYVREIYVCFHASTSQSIVELAFTQNFGSYS